MSRQLLVLHPRNAVISKKKLAQLTVGLTHQGFLGETFDSFGERRHRPGQRFFDLILFERSHKITPLIPTEGGFIEGGAEDSRDHCSISLSSSEQEEFLPGGEITADPLCPRCGYELQEWSDMLNDWYADKANYLWQCPGCSIQVHPRAMDWRHHGGFGNCRISIDGIMDDEAVPSETLLRFLEEQTGALWTYFYSWW
jgi:hypothetical protein